MSESFPEFKLMPCVVFCGVSWVLHCYMYRKGHSHFIIFHRCNGRLWSLGMSSALTMLLSSSLVARCHFIRSLADRPVVITQALRASQELNANIISEQRLMHEFHSTWHATITPHQIVRGELAAWPHGIYTMQLIRSLGA